MLEISPLLPVYPVIKPVKIKKDDHFSEQRQGKEKQVLEEEQDQDQPVHHIDEIV